MLHFIRLPFSLHIACFCTLFLQNGNTKPFGRGFWSVCSNIFHNETAKCNVYVAATGEHRVKADSGYNPAILKIREKEVLRVWLGKDVNHIMQVNRQSLSD